MIDHPDPKALAGRLLSDAGIDPHALTLSRADVEAAVAGAFRFGAATALAGVAKDRACRVCGCTRYRACPGSCSWVSQTLCSSCAPFVEGGR